MKIKFLMSLAIFGVAILLAGCVNTVDGRMEAGVPFTKDKIEARYQRSVPDLVAAVQKVLARNGTLISNDTVNNVTIARVDTRIVWVKVMEVDPTISGLTVQARSKSGTADVALASEIDKQIALQLTTNK